MRLWIDVREACKERKTGKGQWTFRCIEELLTRNDVRVTLLSDALIPSAWRKLPGVHDVRVFNARGMLWHVRVSMLLLRQRRHVDLYVSPTSYIVPFFVGRFVAVLPVVHDLIALNHEPHDRKARFIERVTLPRALRTARAICCVSAATATLVRQRFVRSARCVLVGAGPTIDERDTWTCAGDHILCIATLCPRKNQLRLIDAFESLSAAERAGIRLVLVGGRGWQDDPIVQRASSTPGVTWVGFQTAESCAELIRTCRVFAYVSEEEGFGLPVLDALRVGAPVLASDIPSIREVAGDAARYCHPLSVASIAAGLTRALADQGAYRLKGIQQADSFTWEKTASHVLDACRSVVDNRCRS